MSVQIIRRCDGVPEYAVLRWDEYQALLKAASGYEAVSDGEAGTDAEKPASLPCREWRRRLGMTLEDAARQVGISPSYLEMIERGEREPDSAIFRALERLLQPAGEGSAP